jgi:hypothetical protein
MYESKHFLLGPFVHSVQLGRFKNRTPARFEYIYWDHTKKRPGQPETARILEITPVVLKYCLNRIFIEIIYGYIIVLNKVLF